MLKRALCLIFAFLLSINSMAAVVSDNDGSAFITKAEFEALKENFASQIENYNTSIDSKIDGAIASYLEGINASKKVYLNTNLDKDGKLKNGITLEWLSGNSSYFGDTSGERLAIETFELYSASTKTNSTFYSSGYSFKERSGNYGASTIPSVSARKYLTSKEINYKLDNGSTVKSQTRMKVRCNLMWNWEEFQFRGDFYDGFSWGPSSPKNLANHSGEIYQNTREYHIANGSVRIDSRWEHGPNWIGWGAITVETKDIADDGESYTYNERLCPLSTYEEMVWDTTVNNQSLTKWGGDGRHNWGNGMNLAWQRPISGGGYFTSISYATTNGPELSDAWIVPWLKQKRVVNGMYLTNLLSTDSRNRQVKNGLILCDTDGAGDYNFKVSANKLGKLYIYIGKTPISNWTATDFSGKKYDISEVNKSYTFEYKDVVDKQTPIWICYLPTDTSDVGILKVEEVYYA